RFATRERFPQVDELRIGIPSELVGEYPLAPSTALVLMAHDYKYDLPVLHKALATDVGYIGMLGSTRRGAAILKLLAEEGQSEAALKRVRVPIGLDIGARSAPEIALAVMAEIQAVRGGGTGLGPLRLGARLEIMKVIAQRRDAATLEGLVGKVLCHDVRDAAAKIAVEKGARLTEAAAKILLATPWEEIHLLAVDPTDLHEEEAGKRLAAAAVGDGVEVKGYTGGQWTLAATRRGLLKVRRQALADANAREGISIFTLFDSQPVEPGETVGKCKVTPL